VECSQNARRLRAGTCIRRVLHVGGAPLSARTSALALSQRLWRIKVAADARPTHPRKTSKQDAHLRPTPNGCTSPSCCASQGCRQRICGTSLPFVPALLLIVAIWMKDNIPRRYSGTTRAPSHGGSFRVHGGHFA